MAVDLSRRGTGGSDSGVLAALKDSGKARLCADLAEGRMPRVALRASPWLRVALLAAIDTMCVVAAAAAAFAVWASGTLGQPAAVYLPLLPGLALVPVVNAASGLYPGFGLGPVETLRRLWRGATAVFLALVASTFVLQLHQIYSRVTLTLAWLGALALLPVGRSLVFRLAGRRRWWPEPVVVIGAGDRAAKLAASLRRSGHVGYRPVALLAPPESEAPADAPVPVLSLDAAPSLAASGVRVALVVERRAGEILGLLAQLQQVFTQVIVLGEAGEMPVEHVEPRNIAGTFGVEYCNELLRPRHRFVKRAMDVVLGTASLVAALPLIGAAALLVKLSSRGPVFFTQDREGIDGERIRVPKLRTMFVDAEQRLRAHLEADAAARAEWESGFKLAHDPRVVPGVGTLLRRTSVDELPQLWSVVRGKMSLVGPRPFPDYHLECFSEPFRALRRRVRPGVTGLWQVTVRSRGGLEDQQAYDTYYIRNWSVWMDLYILARTIEAVVAQRGAC